jgi:hypothetical protein
MLSKELGGGSDRSEAVVRKAMLVKNVSVELKRRRLDLITSTDRIKIVLCESVK